MYSGVELRSHRNITSGPTCLSLAAHRVQMQTPRQNGHCSLTSASDIVGYLQNHKVP
jgi:hypothetical protein